MVEKHTMQLDVIVKSASKAPHLASVARADARVLASDGHHVAGSDVKVSVALDSDSVLDRMIVVRVAQVVDGR